MPAAHGVHSGAILARCSPVDGGRRRTFGHAPRAARSVGARHGRVQSRSAPAAMSLRVRLNLIITALIALFTLVTGKIIVDDMRNSIREEIEAGTRVTMQLLTAVLYESDLARQRTGRDHVLLPFLEN